MYNVYKSRICFKYIFGGFHPPINYLCAMDNVEANRRRLRQRTRPSSRAPVRLARFSMARAFTSLCEPISALRNCLSSSALSKDTSWRRKVAEADDDDGSGRDGVTISSPVAKMNSLPSPSPLPSPETVIVTPTALRFRLLRSSRGPTAAPAPLLSHRWS